MGFPLLRGAALVSSAILSVKLQPSYQDSKRRSAYCQSIPRSYVLTWGNGLQGQLGHGSNTNQPLPKLVEAFQLDDNDAVFQCSCGSSHTACVTVAGKLFTWGRTQDNRLGYGGEGGSCLDQSIPKDIEGLRVSRVACGEFHTLALTQDGKVYSWGKNTRGQCGRPNQYPDKDDDVWAHRQATPPLNVGPIEQGFPNDCRIVEVDCGKQHSLALSQDGTVYVWGYGGEGQLGLGTDTMREKSVASVPTAISPEMFGNKRVVHIAAGSQFSAAVTEDGKLYTWGSDQYGQLGHGKESWSVASPKVVRGLLRYPVAQVACGQYHMAAITQSHEVFTWGYGREGQLGHGTRTDVPVPTLVDQLGNKNVSVSCGGGHTAVVRQTDKGLSLFMFGRGREGQLGRANHLESVVASRMDPVEVELLPNREIQQLQVHCGQDYTLAVCVDNPKTDHL